MNGQEQMREVMREVMRERAVRVLSDGRQHSLEAIAWAARVVYQQPESPHELERQGFTLRELSLGAQQRW